ncbi:MAG: hypothetical protein ACLTE2_05775 [Eubacteriales bacterium]
MKHLIKRKKLMLIMKKFTDLETDMAAFEEKSGGKSVGILFSPIHHHMQGSGGYLERYVRKTWLCKHFG